MNSSFRLSEFLPFESHPGQPKAQWVYNLLRAAIITMKLEPGATIREKETCAELGISRTPMREAVLRLAQEGLVKVVPSGGTFVNTISLRGVIEGHIIRSSLELRMVRLAARFYDPAFDKDFDLLMFLQADAAKREDYDRAFATDNDFHRSLCRVAGFPDIWQTIHNGTGQLDRVRRRAYPRSGHFTEVEQEHAAIYEAVKARDEERAHELMRAHLDDIAPIIEFVMDEEPAVIAQEVDRNALSALRSPGE